MTLLVPSRIWSDWKSIFRAFARVERFTVHFHQICTDAFDGAIIEAYLDAAYIDPPSKGQMHPFHIDDFSSLPLIARALHVRLLSLVVANIDHIPYTRMDAGNQICEDEATLPTLARLEVADDVGPWVVRPLD